MCEEWHVSRPDQTSSLLADAPAALSTAKRQGAGKMRHINVKSLWLQDKAIQKILDYKKVKGEDNPADSLTKHVRQELLERYLQMESLKIEHSRAGASLELAGS